MIVLLSPAKTLDFTEIQHQNHTMPQLLGESSRLVKVLKKKSVKDLQELMSVSEKIAELNVERFQNFKIPYTSPHGKQALLAFKGDVYVGLAAEDFTEEDLSFAQDHLRILSGLYGILKPLDLMLPYRLEMGTRLENGKNKNLYEFWGNKLTNIINEELQQSDNPAVVNLASNEYFKAVNTQKLTGNLYNIDFKEDRDGVLKVISFNAKKARGTMARAIIKNQITKIEDLKALNINGYIFNDELSTERHFLFTK